MTKENNSFWRIVLILFAILAGVAVFIYVGMPLLGLLFKALFLIAAFVAGIVKYILFVIFSVIAIFGILMLVSWIIQEFTE